MTLLDPTPALVDASRSHAARSELRGKSSRTPPVEGPADTAARPEGAAEVHPTRSVVGATVAPASGRSGLRGESRAGKGQGKDGRRGCSMCSFAAGGCERCCPVASPPRRSKHSANLVTGQVPPQGSPFLSAIELMSMAEQTYGDNGDGRGRGVDAGGGDERQGTFINPAGEVVSHVATTAPQRNKTHIPQQLPPLGEGPASQLEVEERKRKRENRRAADEDAGSQRSTKACKELALGPTQPDAAVSCRTGSQHRQPLGVTQGTPSSATLPMQAEVSPPQSPDVSHVANSHSSEGSMGGCGAEVASTAPASTSVQVGGNPGASGTKPQHRPSVQPQARQPSPLALAKIPHAGGRGAHPQQGSGKKSGGANIGADARARGDTGGGSEITKSDHTAAAAVPTTSQPSSVDAQPAVCKTKIAKQNLASINMLHAATQQPLPSTPQPLTAASSQKHAKLKRTALTPSATAAPTPLTGTRGKPKASCTQRPPRPQAGLATHVSTPQAAAADSGEFVWCVCWWLHGPPLLLYTARLFDL